MSTGDHLLHVLNALESRAVVLEEELKEIDSDVNLNATLARKYGNEFFQEGADVLNRTRVRRAGPRPRARARAGRRRTTRPATRMAQIEKQQKLAEIRVQQQETSKSVNMGKAVLSSLNDNFGNPASSGHARAPARRLAPRAYEHALAPLRSRRRRRSGGADTRADGVDA